MIFYDLKKSIRYRIWIKLNYFDECFGISLDFNRKSYTEEIFVLREIH